MWIMFANMWKVRLLRNSKSWEFPLVRIVLWSVKLEVCSVLSVNMFIRTLTGVWPALFGQTQVLWNFDSLPSKIRRETRGEVQKASEMTVNLRWGLLLNLLRSVKEVEFILLIDTMKGHLFSLKVILTLFFFCIFASLLFVELTFDSSLKYRTVNKNPVNSAPYFTRFCLLLGVPQGLASLSLSQSTQLS